MKTLTKTDTMAVPLRIDAFGVMYVGRTRVPLDTVVRAYDQGTSPEEIALRFTALDLADIYAVIGYYLKHRDEIEDYLRRRKAFRDEVRRQVEAKFNPAGIRERLLARRNNRQGATTC